MRKKGMPLIAAGLLLIAGALVLSLYNVADGVRAQRAADGLLGVVAEAITQNSEPGVTMARPEGDAVQEMSVAEKDGNRYVGMIEIPELEIKLPVMENWSYANLKLSPCRFSGSYYTNDMVVCAHNYVTHFSGLRHISMGADVYFTAVDGTVYHYETVNRETLQPEETERLAAADESWDLTLFTCFIGGQTRCVIRCKLVTD